MCDVTALMTLYRRPYTMYRQLAAIRDQTVPPVEVWLFAQEPSQEVMARASTLEFDRVIMCDPNSYYHLRFAVALTAPTQYVCLFDDDAIPGCGWFESCLETMQANRGILGTHGTRYRNLEDYGNRALYGWRWPSQEIHEVDYVGQVWFLEPRWIRHLFAEPLASGSNGEDIELGARAWRKEGIRSFVPPHPAGERRLWGCRDGREFGEDQAASYRRPGFRQERLAILRGEVAQGWSPMFLRHAANLGASQTDKHRGDPGPMIRHSQSDAHGLLSIDR